MTMFGSQWFAAPSTAAYEIDNSCRFNQDDTAYLERTPSSDPTGGDTNGTQKYTLSLWLKRGGLCEKKGTITVFGARASTSYSLTVAFAGASGSTSDDEFDTYEESPRIRIITNALYRDPSAWMHMVYAVDTTQSNADDRIKIYINGTEVSYRDHSPFSLNDYTWWNANGILQRIGAQPQNTTYTFDGYMSEFHNIDGVAAHTEFAETNDDGVWVPKEYAGTYGTNGFFLEFGTSSALGDDTSGNGNDLSSSGLAAADQMIDTPTNNFCVINPLIDDAAGHNTATISDGNLKIVASGSSVTYRNPGTFLLNSGKWYWEGKVIGAEGGSDYSMLGIYSINSALGTASVGGGAAQANEWLLRDNGDAQHDGGGSSTGLGDFASNDIIQIALDMDAKKMWFGRQNTFDGDPAAGTGESFASIDTNIVPLSIGYGGGSGQGNWLMNFGQSSFAYTPPTGFNAINTSNIAAPTLTDPSTNFQTVLYTGNGVAIGSGGKTVNEFTGNSSMQPDFVWIKNRDTTDDHAVYDTTRGTTKQIEPNNTDAQTTQTEGLTTFGSDSFTVGDLAAVNTSGEDYVAWCWEEGATPGFDIVTWTGSGVARTISHSLSAVPKMMIVKGLSARDWMVYHVASNSTPEDYYMRLDTNAVATDESTIWNDTAPTSSVFSVGTGNGVNANTETYIGYLFANVEGFSKFISYTGNGDADGPFVNCGFRPAFVMGKNADASEPWWIFDTARNTYNVANSRLQPNLTSAEDTQAWLDINSNGFKVRDNGGAVNQDGSAIVFAAFAENPFGGDGVAPATARQ